MQTICRLQHCDQVRTAGSPLAPQVDRWVEKGQDPGLITSPLFNIDITLCLRLRWQMGYQGQTTWPQRVPTGEGAGRPEAA